jgi:hypothetical protein
MGAHTHIYAITQDSAPHNNESVVMALIARRHGIDLNLSVAKIAAYAGQNLEVEQRYVAAVAGRRAWCMYYAASCKMHVLRAYAHILTLVYNASPHAGVRARGA